LVYKQFGLLQIFFLISMRDCLKNFVAGARWQEKIHFILLVHKKRERKVFLIRIYV